MVVALAPPPPAAAAVSVTVMYIPDPDKQRIYTCAAREAVMAAFTQSLGDGSTWDYEKRYGTIVRETKHGWTCGNWWARDPAKPIGIGEPEIVKRQVSSEWCGREDKSIIAPNEHQIVLSTHDVNEDGYIKNDTGRLLVDILKDLNKSLAKVDFGEDGWSGDYMGFSFMDDYGDSDHRGRKTLFPVATFNRWAVFGVTGGSEGHYVHAEIIHRNGSRQLIFLYKTFQGRRHAQKICEVTAALLGA